MFIVSTSWEPAEKSACRPAEALEVRPAPTAGVKRAHAMTSFGFPDCAHRVLAPYGKSSSSRK